MKLLKVIANNFKLCEKNFTINFIPTANKTREDKEFELQEIDENLFTFNTIGIVGKNASGKTTTVELLNLVYKMFSEFQVDMEMIKAYQEPINLKVYFYHEKNLYYYVTDLIKEENAGVVFFENQKIYQRKYQKSLRNLFDDSTYKEVESEYKLPDNISNLFFIFQTIQTRGTYCQSNDNYYKNFAKTYQIYNLLYQKTDLVKSILKMLDDHIRNIKNLEDNKYLIIYKNNTEKEVTSKELYEVLSSGTSKGLSLFTNVVFSLQSGYDLIIDEIENHFHKALVENLINLYKDKSVNKKNATLIFTTHYCELLDLFTRNDNIYICKFDKKIRLENMHETYNIRPEFSKSNKYYENFFETNVDYEALMNFKKDLM